MCFPFWIRSLEITTSHVLTLWFSVVLFSFEIEYIVVHMLLLDSDMSQYPLLSDLPHAQCNAILLDKS